MKLYHGTAGSIARRAFKEGLWSRSELEIEGNWEDCPSNPDLVYLTRAYAGYFAAHAEPDPDHLWGIVEVDTDVLDDFYFFPDEDYMEQSTRQAEIPEDDMFDGLREAKTMEERTAWFRANLGLYADRWEQSIERLSTCGFSEHIPPEAITKVCLFQPRSNGTISGMCVDPFISLINYALMGAKYRALTDWLMGYDVDPAVLAGQAHFIDQVRANKDTPDPTGMYRMILKQVEAFEKLMLERDGIEMLIRELT